VSNPVRQKLNTISRKSPPFTEHFLLPTDAHNVKNAELLKHSKLDKNVPTCIGLHRNHLQGAKVSAWL